jgi:hypothetical protein
MELQELMQDDDLNIFGETGYPRPLAMVQLEWKEEMIQCLILHYCLSKIAAVFDQIREGLETLRVVQLMEKHGSILKPLFCYDPSRK